MIRVQTVNGGKKVSLNPDAVCAVEEGHGDRIHVHMNNQMTFHVDMSIDEWDKSVMIWRKWKASLEMGVDPAIVLDENLNPVKGILRGFANERGD